MNNIIMDKKTKETIITGLGIFYILVGITAFFNAFYYGQTYHIFWFCYTGILIIGLGIILRNSVIVKSQIYILLIPDLYWLVALLFYILTGGNSFLKTVDYLFLPGPILPKLVSLQHIFTIPLLIATSCKFKNKTGKIWIISFIEIVIFFFVTRIFTSPAQDINCVYNLCTKQPLNISPFIYPILWLVAGFLMIYMSKIITDRLFKKLSCLI